MTQPIPKSKLPHLTDRKKWRVWLKKNRKSKDEIWLVYAKKHTGKPRISYNDAVEEALCFGWIDSIVKSLDEARSDSDDMGAFGWVELIDGKLALLGSDP